MIPMKITRRFSKPGQDVFASVEWEKRTSRISNPDGSVVFEMTDAEIPKQWSQLATDIMVSKYFRKASVPQVDSDGNPKRDESGNILTGPEQSARQVIHRLAGCWRYWGEKHGYFDTAEDAQGFYDELAYMLLHQMCAPNSPQWFNTGLNFAYGITGPAQGHFYCDPKTGELLKSRDAYSHPQPHACQPYRAAVTTPHGPVPIGKIIERNMVGLEVLDGRLGGASTTHVVVHNCFIQSVKDDLVNDGGIMDLWTREARLFKFGSGTGSNYSCIRGENEPLSGGGKSSGLMSFLRIGDRAAGAIKSGGTTRRAAKMVIVDADHPDIENFIDWKVIEEQKVAALVAGSKAAEKHLNAIITACRNCEGSGEDCFDPKLNPALKREVKAARRAFIPENYIERVIAFAKQGHDRIEFRVYDTDWDSDAYMSVAGQNSNNTVRVTDGFLNAVVEDGDWELKRRKDSRLHKRLKARDLWDKISYAAWACADPGIQFHSTINDWHTCPKGGEIRASNPCSEYMFLDDTACNLASLNLMAFRHDEPKAFDIAVFEHAVRLWSIILEMSVLM